MKEPLLPMAMGAMVKKYNNTVPQTSLNSMIARVLSENS